MFTCNAMRFNWKEGATDDGLFFSFVLLLDWSGRRTVCPLTLRAMASAVSGWSPVTIATLTC